MTEYRRLTGMILVLLVLLMLLIVMVMVAIQAHGEEDLPEGGGMPCENPAAFKEWYENYLKELDEQKAGEEDLEGQCEAAEAESDAAAGSESYETHSEDRNRNDEPEMVEILGGALHEGGLGTRPLYTVNGAFLTTDLQNYLYNMLAVRGKASFFPIALCQIYQESRFNPYAVAPNGLDKGLCQFRETFFPLFAQESGLVQYDIFNPIDSLYVYAYLMSKYIDMNGGDIYGALSMYFTGPGGAYCDQYVHDVMQWQGTLREVQ